VTLALTSERGALDALGTTSPAEPTSCPEGSPGAGEYLLGLDRAFAELEARGFRP
jgi:hypothetical protein